MLNNGGGDDDDKDDDNDDEDNEDNDNDVGEKAPECQKVQIHFLTFSRLGRSGANNREKLMMMKVSFLKGLFEHGQISKIIEFCFRPYITCTVKLASFDVRILPSALIYRLIVRQRFWQICANSLSNNGNKLPTCPTLSNGCMSHPDRWMDLFSQELLLQVYIRRG